MEALTQFLAKQWQAGLPMMLARAICVAAIVELLVWLVNLRLRKALAAALRRGDELQPEERQRREAVVLGWPLGLNRCILYTVGLLMILRIFRLQTHSEILPVLVLAVAVVLIALRGPLRDAVRGYVLAYDHAFAPGDHVSVADLSGIVRTFALRTTTLQLPDGRQAVVRNSDIRTVINHSRTAEGAGASTPEHVS